MVQVVEHRTEVEAAPSIWSPAYASLLLCLGLALGLVLFYFFYIKPFIFLPADILIWAETNFVGDIIKLRIGAPIYTDPSDNNSLVYTPAAPILTYAISWIIGEPTSIVAWRLIQLGFVTCAALLATRCCRMLRNVAYPYDRFIYNKTWLALTFLAMFLAATAPDSNRLVHCLHADALALLVSIFSFWTILSYLRSPSIGRITLMAVCPAVGYLTKQLLMGWFAVMFVFLLLHNPRAIRRLGFFTIAAAAFIGMAMGLCYLLWGDNYIFWTFKVMSGERNKIVFSPEGFHISLARSLDHTIRAWMQIAIGVAGGALILRKGNLRKLGPLWAAWLALIAIEATTSGAGWNVLYHFGPGIVIGAIWMFAALPRLWPSAQSLARLELPRLQSWIRPLIAAAGVLTVFIALHVVPRVGGQNVRSWSRPPLTDVYRYISSIEHEFDGLPAEEVLLDVGNWFYLRHSVLAKDRAVSLADQPCNGMYENFDVMVGRIRSRTYSKILVRDLHSPLFLYDWSDWERSSGVRDALLENYEEVRTIPAVSGRSRFASMIMYTGPVSVLIVKSDLVGSSKGRLENGYSTATKREH